MSEQLLRQIADRLAAYEQRGYSREITDIDDMLLPGEGAIAQYFATGVSAVNLMVQAMVLSGRTDFATILDLPAGAGRVARHLVALFPTSHLYVSDINTPLVEWSAQTFGAEVFNVKPDFSEPPAQQFDLIFVGSLFTHFPEPLFRAAASWFVTALAPRGIAVITLHGRRGEEVQASNQYIPAQMWQQMVEGKRESGIGYAETGGYGESPYGLSLTDISWVMRLFEHDPRVRVLGYHEGGWNDHQDVLILQAVATP